VEGVVPTATGSGTIELTSSTETVNAVTPTASAAARGTAPLNAVAEEVAVETPGVDVRTLRDMRAPVATVNTTTPTLEPRALGTVYLSAEADEVEVTTPAFAAAGNSPVSFAAPPAVIQSASPFITVELVDRLTAGPATITSSAETPTATGSGTATANVERAAEVEAVAPTPFRLSRILVAPLETISYTLAAEEARADLSFGKPPTSRRKPIENQRDERETRASIGDREDNVTPRDPSEPADVEIQITDTVTPIPETGESVVTARIRNTVSEQRTVTAELNIDSQDVSNPVDSVTLDMDARSATRVELKWQPFTGAGGTTFDATAALSNDSDTTQIKVEPTVAGVEYRPEILNTNAPIIGEDGSWNTLDVEVRYINFGADDAGTGEQVYLDTGQKQGVDTQDLILASGESATITHTWQPAYYLDGGEYDVTARGEAEADIPDQTVRDRVTDTVTVELIGDPIDIRDPEGKLHVNIQGTNSPVNEGEAASVNVEVTNPSGSEEANGTIVLANQSYGSGYGRDVGYAEVEELQPNGVTTVPVVWATREGDKGDHNLTVRSGCANGVNDDESIDIPNDDCADETTVTVEETDGAITPWALNVTLDGVESPIAYTENATVVANITHVGNVSMSGISKLNITGQGRNDVGVDVSGLNLGPAETVRKTFTWNASAGFEPPSGGSENFEACVEVWRDGTADPPDDVACSTITVESSTYALTQSATARNGTVGSAEATVETVPAGYEKIRYSWSFDDDGAPGRANQRVWELKYDGSAIETKIWSSDEYVSAGGTETIPLPDTDGGTLEIRANDGKASIGPP
jgi:hypothetical protein